MFLLILLFLLSSLISQAVLYSDIFLQEESAKIERQQRRTWMSYEEAKALMKTEGIQNYKQFEQWKQNGKKPQNFPSRPDRVYKEKWKNWKDFLDH